MKIKLKIPQQIYSEMLGDLKREHPFAHERVGFLFTSSKQIDASSVLEHRDIDRDEKGVEL
jgi:proteasome lid subunit RPN8/RPN11